MRRLPSKTVQTISQVKTMHPQSDIATRLDRLDRIARRMDRAFRIPFTNIRFGWDPVLGMLPGIGDTLAVAPALYIMNQAREMGASKPVLLRMAGNIGLDWVVGLVPLVGDILDVGVKGNTRNMILLRKHLNSPAYKA